MIAIVTVHTLPAGDLFPHIDSVACPCGPLISEGSTGRAVLHNAWDGREESEAIDDALFSECTEGPCSLC